MTGYKHPNREEAEDAMERLLVRNHVESLEKALLWCVRNLTARGHHEMQTDPSNGVMRAIEAIRDRRNLNARKETQ